MNETTGEASSAKPSKRLWAMLHEGKLSLHKSFGELEAKVIVPMDKAKVAMRDHGGPHFELEVTYKSNTYPLAGVGIAEENHRWRTALQLSMLPRANKMTQKAMDSMFQERAWVSQRNKTWFGCKLAGVETRHGRNDSVILRDKSTCGGDDKDKSNKKRPGGGKALFLRFLSF